MSFLHYRSTISLSFSENVAPLCGISSFLSIFLLLKIVIALIFTFYVLSFTIDLLPAVRTRHHVPQGEKELSGNRSSTQDEVVADLHPTRDSLANNGSSYRGQVINGHITSPAAQNRRALDV